MKTNRESYGMDESIWEIVDHIVAQGSNERDTRKYHKKERSLNQLLNFNTTICFIFGKQMWIIPAPNSSDSQRYKVHSY